MTKAYETIGVETEVMDASPYRLVQMLFERCVQHIQMSKHYMERSETIKKCESISKAMDIIAYLKLSLNMTDPESMKLSTHLNVVYTYIDSQLLEANRKNDPQCLDNALSKLLIIKSAWNNMRCENAK